MNQAKHKHVQFVKPTLLLGIFSLLLTSMLFSQAPYWGDAGKEGGSSPDGGRHILVNDAGEKYLIGRFQNTINFGAAGSLTTISGNDSYVLKYDTMNDIQWVVGLRGPALHEEVLGFELDQAGNLWIAGNFSDSIVIGNTVVRHSGNSLNSAYLAAINPTGSVTLTREVGTASEGLNLSGMSMDKSDNIYLAGDFAGNMNIDGQMLPSQGGADLFFSRFNDLGQMQWAKSFGANEFDEGIGMAVSPQGDMFATAWISNEVQFGNTSSGIFGQTTFLLLKLDKQGNIGFVNNQPGVKSSDNLNLVALNDQGDVFVGGFFQGNITLSGTAYASVSGSRDILISAFNSRGRLQWVQTAGGFSSDEAKGIAVDEKGNVYLAGTFNSSATFGSISISSPSFFGDGFFARYDRNGNADWAIAAGAGGFDLAAAYGIFVDDKGIGYATGEFTGSLNLSGNTLTASGGVDLFWGSFCQSAELEIDGQVAPAYCLGETLDVPVKTFGCFDGANIFYLELSDVNGSFLNADTIGSVAASGPVTVSGLIPDNISAGTGYRVRVSSNAPQLVSDDNGTDLTVRNDPAPVLAVNGNPTFCQGDSVRLVTRNTYNTYLWSNGATTSNIFASQSGIYGVTVTDVNGCTGNDTIQVVQAPVPNPNPVIAPAGVQALCNNDPVSLDAGSGYASYLWSNGDTSSQVTIAAAGMYDVTVTNSYGCTGQSAMVQVVNSVRPTISQVNDTLISTQAVSYQWNLNGTPIAGATGQTYVPSTSGNYSVTITTAYGCVEESDPFPVVLTSAEDAVSETGFVLYPNPASAVINMEIKSAQSDDYRIEILDLTGSVVARKLVSGSGNLVASFEVSGMPAGFYLARVSGSSFSTTGKFQVVR